MRIVLPFDLEPDASTSLVRSLTALSELRQLEKGWDGGRAVPISDDACAVAASLLVSLAIPAPPSPQLVPLSDGGVQLEWHVHGNDVEIEVDARGEVHFFVAESGGTVVVDQELPPSLLDSQISEVKRHLARMRRLLQDGR